MGVYCSWRDDIAFKGEPSLNTIVHETGHAMDYMYNSFLSPLLKNTFGISGTAKETFEKEMANYIASGKQPYKKNPPGTEDEFDPEEFNYCTVDILEMFAECYTLLMLGDCNSKDCILNHFPKTLENVKKHIAFVRSNIDSIRH